MSFENKKSTWKELSRRLRQFKINIFNSILLLFWGQKQRRFVIGFGPKKVPPHGTETVSVPAGCLFRGEKIVATGESDNLFISGLFVGTYAQIPFTGDGIPLGCYKGEVVDNELMMDICEPGQNITFQIKNNGETEREFQAAIIGHVYDRAVLRAA